MEDDFYLPDDNIIFKEEYTSLIQWYYKHQSHKRTSKTATLFEKTLTGEINYVLLLCLDCKQLLVVDKFEVKSEIL
jgi:hypothetical protein